MEFIALFAGALVMAFLAMTAAEKRLRGLGVVCGLAALLLVGFSATAALPQSIPPPTAQDERSFRLHATHPNCQYAVLSQDVAATHGRLDDWRWAAVGWKVCALELRASGAPPEALHFVDYQLVMACEHVYARNPDSLLRACE